MGEGWGRKSKLAAIKALLTMPGKMGLANKEPLWGLD